MDADRQAGAERRQQRLRGIRGGVVAEQLRRLVHHVRRQRPDEVELAEARLGQRAAFHGPHLAWIGPSLGGQCVEAFPVDRFESLAHGAVSCVMGGTWLNGTAGWWTSPSSRSTCERTARNPSFVR